MASDAQKPDGSWEQLGLISALRVRGASPAVKALLKELCRFAAMRSQVARPSIPTLAKCTGFSIKTVRRALQFCARRGLLRIERRQGKTSIFKLNWSLIRESAARKNRLKYPSHGDRTPTVTRHPSHGDRTPTVTRRPSHGDRTTPPMVGAERFQSRGNKERDQSSGASARFADVGDPISDDSYDRLFQRMRKNHPNLDPNLSERLFVWARNLTKGRSKTTPRNIAFYEKAIPQVLENLNAERNGFLADQAAAMLSNGHSDGDVREALKQLCAENDLPYDQETIIAAVECAEKRLERKQQVKGALHAGRGPEAAQ